MQMVRMRAICYRFISKQFSDVRFLMRFSAFLAHPNNEENTSIFSLRKC